MLRFASVGILPTLLTAHLLAANCKFPGNTTSGLPLRDGYAQFLPTDQIQKIRAALPKVENAQIDRALNSSDTIWYDEASMAFSYQDSIETVTGLRANCVGRTVGETNATNPGIAKLMEFFGTDYRFEFPFDKAAGTHRVNDPIVVNFWLPPKQSGTVLPVKYWRPTRRGHWYWTFPIGTIFGEVLFERINNSSIVVYEIRTRTRYSGGWSPGVFRPFATAVDLAAAVKQLRRDWESSPKLRKYVEHLLNPATLISNRWESKPFGAVFPVMNGALDPLPDPGDPVLIENLLTTTPFVSTEGTIWKENGTLETYAPGSTSESNIVPKNYEMGMVAVNEVSCKRCHSETSRKLHTFAPEIQLYGEVWGEDQTFTWHLFEPKKESFSTWDDEDGSRTANPRLVKAKLITEEKPLSSDSNYRPLSNAFDLPPFSTSTMETP